MQYMVSALPVTAATYLRAIPTRLCVGVIPLSDLPYADIHIGCPLYYAALMLHVVALADAYNTLLHHASTLQRPTGDEKAHVKS